MDARIGKYNGVNPTLTIDGNPAIPPFMMTIDIGEECYVVRDVFPSANWQEKVAELRKQVAVTKKVVKGGTQKHS